MSRQMRTLLYVTREIIRLHIGSSQMIFKDWKTCLESLLSITHIHIPLQWHIHFEIFKLLPFKKILYQ